MRIAAKARRLPLRLAAGAFVLNAGLGKWSADEETATRLHGMAAGTYPVLARIKPRLFVRLLSAGEITMGAAVLLPVVPAAVAGAGLTAFSASLLGTYLRTPALTRDDGIRPSPQGVAMAKDVWLLGIGLGLLADALTDALANRG